MWDGSLWEKNEQITQVVPFPIYFLAIKEDYNKALFPMKVFSQLVADEKVKRERPRAGEVMHIWQSSNISKSKSHRYSTCLLKKVKSRTNITCYPILIHTHVPVFSLYLFILASVFYLPFQANLEDTSSLKTALISPSESNLESIEPVK